MKSSPVILDIRLNGFLQIGTMNEKMKWSLFGERLGVCIFNLQKTRECLIMALNFVAHIAARGGMFLFITAERWRNQN